MRSISEKPTRITVSTQDELFHDWWMSVFGDVDYDDISRRWLQVSSIKWGHWGPWQVCWARAVQREPVNAPMLMFFRFIFVHVFRWTSRVASSWSTGSSRGTCTGRPRTGFGNLSGPDFNLFSPPTFRSDDNDIGKVFNWKLWGLSFAPPSKSMK